MENRNDWFHVRNRILSAPPEYHEARHQEFLKERKRQEEKYLKRDNNQHKLACGCVQTVDPYMRMRSVTVHFCPTHWKERKRA